MGQDQFCPPEALVRAHSPGCPRRTEPDYQRQPRESPFRELQVIWADRPLEGGCCNNQVRMNGDLNQDGEIIPFLRSVT